MGVSFDLQCFFCDLETFRLSYFCGTFKYRYIFRGSFYSRDDFRCLALTMFSAYILTLTMISADLFTTAIISMTVLIPQCFLCTALLPQQILRVVKLLSRWFPISVPKGFAGESNSDSYESQKWIFPITHRTNASFPVISGK